MENHNTPPTASEWKETLQANKGLVRRFVAWFAGQPFYSVMLKARIEKMFPPETELDDYTFNQVQQICIFEDEINDDTLFAYFVAHAPLNSKERAYYTRWKKQQIYGFFLILDVFFDKGVYVEDLYSGEKYYIADRSTSTVAKVGAVLVGRLAPHTEKLWIAIGNCHYVPEMNIEELRLRLKKARRRPEQNVVDAIFLPED